MHIAWRWATALLAGSAVITKVDYLFRCASISSTYPGEFISQLVSWSVGQLVSQPQTLIIAWRWATALLAGSAVITKVNYLSLKVSTIFIK